MTFLWRLVKSKGNAKAFPPDFPHAICQALAIPLAKPGMLRANITRSVYTLIAAGAEVIVIAHLMNSCLEQLLAITGGAPEAIPIVEVEPEEFDFNGNLSGKL